MSCGTVSFDDYRNAWAELPNTPDVAGQPAVHAVHGTAPTAVTSALLRMGCNVAAVEIDKLLAFQDEEPGFTHIRVLSGDAVPVAQQGAFMAEIAVPLTELKSPSQLWYVCAFRNEGRCSDFVIISRANLDRLRLNEDLGAEHDDDGTQFLVLTFEVTNDALTCGGKPLNHYRNAWLSLPPLAAHQA